MCKRKRCICKRTTSIKESGGETNFCSLPRDDILLISGSRSRTVGPVKFRTQDGPKDQSERRCEGGGVSNVRVRIP